MDKKAILIGAAISLTLFFAAVFAAGWWVLAVWQSEMYLANYFGLTKMLAPCVGGAGAGFKADKLPWRHGALVGVFYAVLLALIGWSLVPGLGTINGLLNNLIISVLLGSIGGVIGKNLKRASGKRKQEKSLTKTKNYK